MSHIFIPDCRELRLHLDLPLLQTLIRFWHPSKRCGRSAGIRFRQIKFLR